MAIIQICPICGSIGYPVFFETVASLTNKGVDWQGRKDCSACIKKECNVAYFSGTEVITVSEMKVPFWYKDDGINVPVCYCSDLTRADVEDAVKNGSLTIDDVQEYTKKNITGNCKKENPLGQCCRNVFIQAIEKNKK
jgi:hypothetical protein